VAAYCAFSHVVTNAHFETEPLTTTSIPKFTDSKMSSSSSRFAAPAEVPPPTQVVPEQVQLAQEVPPTAAEQVQLPKVPPTPAAAPAPTAPPKIKRKRTAPVSTDVLKYQIKSELKKELLKELMEEIQGDLEYYVKKAFKKAHLSFDVSDTEASEGVESDEDEDEDDGVVSETEKEED
jgi:hypothetical protein